MNTAHRQRGARLVEALGAFLVLSLGIAIVSRVHDHLRLHADIARQRAEAVRFAQQDIEELRSFATLGPAAGFQSYDSLVTVAQPIGLPPGHVANTTYTLGRDVGQSVGFKTAHVAVHWTDTAGAAHHATLDTVVARTDPALAASLTVPRAAVRGALGRSSSLPLRAVDLGDGRSALKPRDAGTLAWVFDNATGELAAECTVAATLLTQQITVADLSGCDAATGVVLDGQVRFAPGLAPLVLDIELVLTGASYAALPACASELRKTVAVTTVRGSRMHEVPADAQPALLGAAAWRDTGERFVAYHCVVTPHAGRWSGRSAVIPVGWTIGTAAGEHRVCRYSGDHDGSGAIDSNAEHPAAYTDVSGALMHQNFLVVAGPDTCPAGSPRLLGVGLAQVFVDAGTVQHQP